MDTPRTKEKKFPQNKIYKKNIKARGQKLQISKHFNKNKESATNNKIFLNKYKNYTTKDNSIKNTEKKNILEEIINTKNKIVQYENYLKKSLNQKLPNEINQSKAISSYKNNNNNDYNLPKQIDINNILNSINQKYNDYNNFSNAIKKAPNISLINNSLILNYMNKVNNNISVKSNITSNDNSIHNSNSDILFTPNYKTIKNTKSIFNNNRNNNKNEIITNINKGRIRINRPKISKISKSCNKFYDYSFGKKNRSILKNIKSISINKIDNNSNIEIKKKKNKLSIRKDKNNLKLIHNKRRTNTANIEKLIDIFIEKKLEKEKDKEECKEIKIDVNNEIVNKAIEKKKKKKDNDIYYR